MITILHGALGSAHQFAPLQNAIGGPSRVITFIGHGNEADISEPWSIELFSRQLEQALELDHPKTPAQIFGYSMGGYVALDCAIRRPDLVAKIVTLGTKLLWTSKGALDEIKKLDADIIKAKVPAFAADLALRHGENRWRTVLAKTADLMIALGSHPLLTADRCSEITVPVRYGLGDRDEMVSLQETVEWYKATPHAELSVLPLTRHPIERVDTNQLVRHITSFLAP